MADGELTKPMVVNWALAELGQAPSFSADDETPLGGLIDIFWPRCQAHCIGLHDWTRFRQTFKLARLDTAPENGWRYGFMLPGERYGPQLKAFEDPRNRIPLRAIDVEGNTLYADVATVYVRCKVAKPLEEWDPQFASAFAVMLASYLAVPLLQDIDLKLEKERAAVGHPQEGGAGGLFGRLIAQDRAGQPLGSPQAGDDTLLGGRLSGPWYGRI